MRSKCLEQMHLQDYNCYVYIRIGISSFHSREAQRYGRRIGLATGFIVGGFGAIGVVMAALTNSIILLLISLLIYGAGTATNLQARYAGTDLADKKREQRLLVLRW